MNIKRSTAVLLGALTAVIVFLNFYLAIYRIHFFDLFYDFSSDISEPRAVLSAAILIGGLTYIVLAILRLRNGNIPVVMIVLPLLSVLLYRFIFEYNTLGLVLPLITMVIQFVLGIVPTILWVIVNWVLRLLPFPSIIHTALSVAAAVVLAVGSAFLLNRKAKYKRKAIVKTKTRTKRGKHKHSSTHTEVTSGPEQTLYQQDSDSVSGTGADNAASDGAGQTTATQGDSQGDSQGNSQSLSNDLSSNIYEKHGYTLDGQVLWSGSMQAGSCTADLSLRSRAFPDHAYRITGSGWESSDSLTGVLQVNASVESVSGTDRYDISGTVQYDESDFARVALQLSDSARTVSYSIKGEISNFSSTQSGFRHVHLIFEDLQGQNDFYVEGSYETSGLH